MNDKQENKYTKQLLTMPVPTHGLQWGGVLQLLLHLMRPEVEEIFEQWGLTSPPSQSNRASRVLDEINNEISDMVKRKAPLAELSQLFRKRDLLKDFLAVHRTVWILEGKPL